MSSFGQPLKISFRATGEGYVLCERKNQAGKEVEPIRYYSYSSVPERGALAPEKWDEYVAAFKEEFGIDRNQA
ncbi:hypothetical protein SZ64_04620 [Erythrobacter sp. SG61-1L]|uniref:hypothetical protein n=1 Tax=Erythrobacter sp. SG61-1L TaxID=1603897 RepID=UPI0006C938F0|nr:hypothetical protein [Erythrobacter sp. SG61-1L]KPL67449.1 hypothetical protein SZ64_04620 [Erythrobacter sp. SG61-1L]